MLIRPWAARLARRRSLCRDIAAHTAAAGFGFTLTRMGKGSRNTGWMVASAVFLAALTARAGVTRAQGGEAQISTGPARSVDLRTAPEVPPVPPPPGLVTNRPTIPMADYLAAKRAAAMKPRQPKPARRP
jgi:hypothetical protein